MTPALAPSELSDGSKLYVFEDGTVKPLDERERDSWSAGVASVVDQEVHGRLLGAIPARVTELLDRFGFEWEPAGGPGYLRFQPAAATILHQVAAYAEAMTRRVIDDLGLAYDRVDGINLVDGRAPLLHDYLELVGQAPGIYGSMPYELAPPNDGLLLRQAACLQKFAIARSWDLTEVALPRCVYELSDSFRHEPEASLQRCFRLRRFRVPEAHVHAGSVADAVAVARPLHRHIVRLLQDWTAQVALLVSVTDDFSRRQGAFIKELAAEVDGAVVLKVRPPGALCEDGVEIDVEYKFVDAGGFARELTTFQIDELITRSFGLTAGVEGVATIHLVLTGSLERFVFAALDRIARAEAEGRVARLPLWMSPVIVRALWSVDDPPPPPVIEHLQAALDRHGIRGELDDRAVPLDRKCRLAHDDLVPFQVLLDGSSRREALRVRRFEDEAIEVVAVGEFVDCIKGATDFGADWPPGGMTRLSRSAKVEL